MKRTPSPSLSIIVPTFNTASMTLRCCAAVMAALPEGAELIVVDDHSSDDSAALLREHFPGALVISRSRNGGFARAANEGLAAATGAILMLLNSDAIVHGDALRAITAAFAEDPKLGIAGGRLQDGRGALRWSGGAAPTLRWLTVTASGVAPYLPRRARATLRHDTPDSREVDWVSGAAMAIRREVWSALGPLREDFRFYAQDLDLCMQAKRAGWRVKIIGNAIVTHEEGTTVAGGSELSFVPELLWPDLILWFRDARGVALASAASRAMETAASLRIAALRIRALPSAGASRRRRHSIIEALARGVASLRAQRRAMSRS